jgi:hypothetical protein
MSPSRLTPVAGLIVLTLGACGEGQDGASESAAADDPAQIRAAIQRVWNDVYDASRAGDGERVCRHATARYARGLVAAAGGKTCAEAARNAGRLVKDAVPAGAAPRYSAFTTSGARARIRVTLPAEGGPLRNDVRFRLVDGEWRVDGDSGLDAQ